MDTLTAMQLARRALTWRSESSRSPEERTAIDVLDIAILQAEKQEPVGIAASMPGTNGGFTMATFRGEDVPDGTALYAAPVAQITEADLLAILPASNIWVNYATHGPHGAYTTDQMLAFARSAREWKP